MLRSVRPAQALLLLLVLLLLLLARVLVLSPRRAALAVGAGGGERTASGSPAGSFLGLRGVTVGPGARRRRLSDNG